MFARSSRKPYRRTSRKKGPTTSTLARTKASKRYNWINALDGVCDVGLLPPHLCTFDESSVTGISELNCLTGAPTGIGQPARFELLPPNLPDGTNLAGYASDDITIVKTVGHISLMPIYYLTEAGHALLATFNDPLKPYAQVAMLAQRNYFLRAGLKKDDFIYDPTTQAYDAPVRDPILTVNWTDGRFSRQWEREKMLGELGSTMGSHNIDGSALGICSSVHKNAQADQASYTAPNWTLATGSGTWAGYTVPAATGDPAIATDCVVVPADSGTLGATNVVETFVLQPDRAIRLPLTSRKRFRLQENQGLNLWLNWTSIDYSNTSDPNNCNPVRDQYTAVGFFVRFHVKMLIET